MTVVFEKGRNWFSQKLPFVLYCKPNSNKLVGIFQKNDALFEITDYTETGFAFVSFDGKNKYLIPKKESDVYIVTVTETDCFIDSEVDLHYNLEAKVAFEHLVAKGIQAIEKNQFKKVVLSRKETLEIERFDFEIMLKKLLFYYPNTLKYCFYHPKIGFWIGATPEQLLQSFGNTIKTVSFAGTQPYSETEDYVWEEKERQEQQFVTDFILESLNKYSEEVSCSKPYTFRAGSIVHIKTDIEATINTKSDFQEIIEKLHPTPAVCGLPKEIAKQFILEKEGYNRTFYTGFLGELNIDFETFQEPKSDLFVNLRCMNLEDNKINVYVGCGITKDSIPEKEFIETVNKSKTMKKVV